ncbi:MAG TPA: molybdopterin-dependent oxidoreductase [Oligoflexus sp.]|uniref:molybdopterin-dependent oxidoreductase n=1 Tax=Oligoflexus sp. TaxID=1971216 RepID=UPI002D7F0F4E|nr:molybdopterin-dependent oxidoreductase [Oligoflexus sp.]HET9240299.1 molybdopterin-dependent oxidoreductase [Oligoflexus sp.]
MSQSVKRVCNLCEAMCGLTIELSDDQSMTIRGNKADVFSQGAFCPKSQGLKDLWQDPDRVRGPLKKVNGQFQPIAWEKAFQEIADRVNALQKKYGRSSIATYAGNPNTHNFGNLILLPMFLRGIRSHNKFSATSVDQLPHMLASYLMFGHQLLLPIADVDNTRYMLMFGANPAVSNGSLLSSAGLSTKLKAIQHRNGKVVLFDPRYTETASLVSEHYFIKPGTDAFLLAALVKEIFARKMVKPGRLSSMIKGLDQLEPLFKDIDLDQVSSITGVRRDVIEQVAKDLQTYEPALCYSRMGVSTQAYGAVCQWLINLINILTGNFDKKGGVLFTKPAVDVVEFATRAGSRGSFRRRKSRVHQLPEFGGEMPVATLADEILTPGEGQIKALITIAGNPVISTPNGRKLEKALGELELQVAIDFYQNETTALAEYILPPTSSLEHSHYDLIFNALAARNIARFSPAIVKSPEGSYEDWEILLELWARIGYQDGLVDRSKKFLVKKSMQALGMERIVDLGLRIGPYRKTGLSLKKLKESPDGIDLGPLEPTLPQRLYTKDKKIDLCPAPMLEAFQIFRNDPAWKQTQQDEADELYLIGRRNLKSNNSWMHNLPSLARSKNQCYLIMNKDDASRRNIVDGSQVQVSSSVGSIEIPVMLSDRIMPGVVSIPHGWGHDRKQVKLTLARKSPGVSLNDIMDDRQVDLFSGNAILNGQRVRVASLVQ